MTISNAIPFIAGNWKLNNTVAEAVELVQGLQAGAAELSEAEVVVIPPFTALSKVKETLKESSIHLGAQNMHYEIRGAYTGEVSAPLLLDVGCKYVVIGHSERRQFFGETNETVNLKIKTALEHNLIPIMCFGESLEEREQGITMAKVENQLTEGLAGLNAEEIEGMVFAYEPIWAIGTGLTATPEQAQEVHAFVRKELAEKYGTETSSCAIILYGGSVKPTNTFSLLKEKDINGALVGGASLNFDSFIEIAKEAIRAYKEK